MQSHRLLIRRIPVNQTTASRYRLLLAVALSIIASSVVLAGPADGQSSGALYLVAATPDASVPGYPARLYQVAAGKLSIIRTILPAAPGTAAVINGPRAIYIIPESVTASAIGIVDKIEPGRAHTLSVSRQQGNPVLVMGTDAVSASDDILVFPVITAKPQPTLSDLHYLLLHTSRDEASSTAATAAEAYTGAFTSMGPAGPYDWFLPLTARNGPQFLLQFMKQDVLALAPSAPDLAPASQAHRFALGANEEYLIASPEYTGSDATRIMAVRESKFDVFDRTAKKWRS
ncbi:MAG TPA: hypothetical protein VGD59_10040 [Acidisarcina sp.]